MNKTAVASGVEEAYGSVTLSTDVLATHIRENLDVLASILIPEEARFPFPDFYKTVWRLVLQNIAELGTSDIFRFALGLPRGHAKTTFLKILVCYLIIHDYEMDFILIVCATEPLAENFLSDVGEMMASPVLSEVYGAWEGSLEKDTKKDKRAFYNGRKIILCAIGAQTSLRGLNIKNRRPNLIICDDVQTKENDESDTERARLLRWLTGTLFKARAKVEKSAILYVGNMYSTDCILYKFTQIANWTSLVTGAILADGIVLWPEINTLGELLEEYEHDSELGEGATWFAEIQNDPVGAICGLLDLGEVLPPAIVLESHTIYPIKFITVDPAGLKKSSDDNVVASHCLIQDQGCTLEINNGKWSPSQVIDEMIRQALKYKIPIVFIESTAYQATLSFWAEKRLKELGLQNVIRVIPLPTGRNSKYQRIKAWVKQFVGKKWHIADQKTYNKVSYQLYAFKADRTDNVDDLLDVLAQAILAMSKHYADIIRAVPLDDSKAEAPKARVMSGNSMLDIIRRAN